MKYCNPILIASLLVMLGGAPFAAGQGTAFTYQGQLTDNGIPARGAYDLRFRLYDDAAAGSQVGTDITVAPVTVSNGLFTVTLDFGAGRFDGSARWLEIGARTSGSAAAHTPLTPRQPVRPTPYALYANTAGTVRDGAVTSNALLDRAVTTAKLADGAVTSGKLAAGAVTSLELADNLTLGSTNASGRLTLWDAVRDIESIRLLGTNHQISLHGTTGAEQLRLDGKIGGHLMLFDCLNGDQTVTLSSGASFSPLPPPNGTYVDSGGSLTLASSTGATHLVLKAQFDGGQLSLFNAGGERTVELLAAESSTNGGLITLRNATGTSTVKLDGDNASAAGGLGLCRSNGTLVCELNAVDAATAARFSMFNAYGIETVELRAAQGTQIGSVLNLKNAAGTNTIRLNGHEGAAGCLGLYQGNGKLMCELDAFDSSSAGQFSMYDTNGHETVEIMASQTPIDGGAIIVLRKRDGTPTITLDADYIGDGRIITQELQITGGSDLSEQFDINAPVGHIQAGRVVSIDPAHPGQLALSTMAYDRTVAGVLSGAGGVKPGMVMGYTGTAADGKHAVALTGRVYCWATADNGAIHPGDLLTTSDTPGHAMKVTDHVRAQGAILGKAMTTLDQGSGLVLVLVSLQ